MLHFSPGRSREPKLDEFGPAVEDVTVMHVRGGRFFTALSGCVTFRFAPEALNLRSWKLISAYVATFAIAATFSGACINVNYSDTAFRCNPTQQGDACPEDFFCCSDDPTTVGGLRYFSGDNNNLSSSGMCIRSSVVNSGQAGLPNGCPVPCNPKWDVGTKEAVCGASSVALCCQTTSLEPEDCIFDVGLQCFRPVNGNDTSMVASCPEAELQARLQATGYDISLARCQSSWSRSAHVTHQDPGVSGGQSACNTFAAAGVTDFWSCVSTLTVADQRGFCLTKSPDVQICPTDLSDADKIANGIPLDACTQMNLNMQYTCG
jgi:hypothetical protein